MRKDYSHIAYTLRDRIHRFAHRFSSRFSKPKVRFLVAIVLAVAFFAGIVLGEGLKLSVLARHVTRLAKRFFGVPDFHYYALADGIATLLARSALGPLLRGPPIPTQTDQKLLFQIE